MENENKNLEGTTAPEPKVNEIDYDKIINGVLNQLKSEVKPNDTANQNTDEYVKKSVEWELKYNTLNDEHLKLKTQLEEANNKLTEANNKLKEYETFGNTTEDIKENSRIVKDYKKQQGGLMKL
jgi:chromosome segregation ATPase